jgi:hypothetical protein
VTCRTVGGKPHALWVTKVLNARTS